MRTKFLKHFTSFFALTGALAGTAHAEILSVQVPFAFVAAGKSLPAGTYMVESVASGILIIHGDSAEPIAIQAHAADSTARGTKPSMMFIRNSDMPVLSSVNMESGSFAVPPVTRAPAA